MTNGGHDPPDCSCRTGCRGHVRQGSGACSEACGSHTSHVTGFACFPRQTGYSRRQTGGLASAGPRERCHSVAKERCHSVPKDRPRLATRFLMCGPRRDPNSNGRLPRGRLAGERLRDYDLVRMASARREALRGEIRRLDAFITQVQALIEHDRKAGPGPASGAQIIPFRTQRTTSTAR